MHQITQEISRCNTLLRVYKWERSVERSIRFYRKALWDTRRRLEISR